MTKSNKDIVLEVLRRSFVARDPTVVEDYFGANYKQHNPQSRTARQPLRK